VRGEAAPSPSQGEGWGEGRGIERENGGLVSLSPWERARGEGYIVKTAGMESPPYVSNARFS